ncbi:MAG TPA: lactate utilization protein [Spirochaetota bacterium]|nr:lactate utilization protein [Spirochaetota bacterium]
MTDENIKMRKILSDITKKSLLKNGFEVIQVNSKEDAIDSLKKIINKDAVIGFGGSRTLEQIGFHSIFTKNDYPNLLDRDEPNISADMKKMIQKRALTADFFVCSANSITTDGQLILIDYTGNRNAGATYGPEKRIFVLGWNKITTSIDNGLKRASNTAAVLNNIRFNMSNPCTVVGYCVNCDSKDKLCRVKTIISRCEPAGSAVVILVNEDLGF